MRDNHDHGSDQSLGKERQRKTLERISGAMIIDALNDPKTVELMCNGDGKLWLEKLGEPMRQIGHLKPSQAESIISTVSGYQGLYAGIPEISVSPAPVPPRAHPGR